MAQIRLRTLGHTWSTVTLPDSSDEKAQLLNLFSTALRTVPELSALPEDLEKYAIFWNGRRVTAYHESVEDGPVFRAEPL
ncbi:hypothetical protein ACF09G_36295 [Streptomyces albogriseolus]|uniref:hypothetical protein n=1 Tax=Streptomyces albogriseolus TaxID=1887 RepID=UPI0019932806|nr:hypothetical protein [Streptomyces sp.]